LREYTVFNVDQCENLPDNVNTGKPMRVRNPNTRDELADAFLQETGAEIREGSEAYYVPSRDFISMPAFAGFLGADHFYNVAFHELTHWTAHKSRLDRDLKNRLAHATTRPKNLLLSWAPPSCAQNLALTGTLGTRATSATGSSF
jgi:antirestriction protein ArdC